MVLGLEDLQAALIQEEAEVWPAFILSLYHGHYEDWARAETASRRGSPFSTVITPLIDSGLGVSTARNHLLQTDPATHYLGTWSFAPHQGSRASWPTPDLGDAMRAPSTSQIPVLFLNGDWDVSTPVENVLQTSTAGDREGSVLALRSMEGVQTPSRRQAASCPAASVDIVALPRRGRAIP
ncbi:hypothetical protein [Sorangium sp. So ce1182]|uniref:hypothetical protein n=1 Tax=Sorangium sp. So ce1182 TaxID=3133334 RepID=UPI003F60FCD5